MKGTKIVWILGCLLSVLLSTAVNGQHTYSVYRTDPAQPPLIDGQPDQVWKAVKMEPVTTVTVDYSTTHGIDPNPPVTDYKMDFGVLWDDEAVYFLVRIVDDTLVFDDAGTAAWNGTQTPAPRWWRDDSFNLLMTANLTTPLLDTDIWEFAWLTNKKWELKASYTQGLLLPTDVECEWYSEGLHQYTAEIKIKWLAFLASPDSGWFALEMRGRDDDLAGAVKYPQTFFQWNSDSSTTHERTNLFTGKCLLLNQQAGTGVADDHGAEPTHFSLAQNHPNPFNPSTRISYTLTQPGQVTLSVYDLQGREVAVLVDGYRAAGRHEAVFNAEALPSGVYFYSLFSNQQSQMKKMMLVK